MARLPRLFALEAIAPDGQESHSREAQGKSQENTADKNNDNHGIISLGLREMATGMRIDGFESTFRYRVIPTIL